jgi:hypothetical protein
MSLTVCPPRGNRFRQAWDRDRVIESVRSWAADYGNPPTSTEWEAGKPAKYAQAALDKARLWNEKAARFDAGTYPSNDTCRRLFGTFGAAIAAAGFEPRPEGRTPRVLTERHREQLRVRMKGDTAGPDQLAQQIKGVMSARAAGDLLALRGALLDLAAVAMAWAERIDLQPEAA